MLDMVNWGLGVLINPHVPWGYITAVISHEPPQGSGFWGLVETIFRTKGGLRLNSRGTLTNMARNSKA